MDKARFIVFEGFGSRLLFFGQQSLKLGDPVPTQAAIETRPRHGRVDELSGDDEQIIKGQKQALAQHHDHPLLGRGQRRV